MKRTIRYDAKKPQIEILATRQIMTTQSMRHVPKAFELMFKQLEHFAEEGGYDLDWSTFKVEQRPWEPGSPQWEMGQEFTMTIKGVKHEADHS
jgi:hypothetical protein